MEEKLLLLFVSFSFVSHPCCLRYSVFVRLLSDFLRQRVSEKKETARMQSRASQAITAWRYTTPPHVTSNRWCQFMSMSYLFYCRSQDPRRLKQHYITDDKKNRSSLLQEERFTMTKFAVNELARYIVIVSILFCMLLLSDTRSFKSCYWFMYRI